MYLKLPFHSLDSRGPFGCDPIRDFCQANVAARRCWKGGKAKCDRGLISGPGGLCFDSNLDE